MSTTVQPAAIAGPALRVIIASGKFQGVMQAHHADRLLDHDDALVGLLLGNGVAVDAFGLFGKPFEKRGGVADFALGLAERLALAPWS